MREAALAGDINRELPLRMVSAVAVAGFAGTWLFSAIDGSRLHARESLEDDLVLAPRAAELPLYLQRPVIARVEEHFPPPSLNLWPAFSDPGVWPAYSHASSAANSQL